MRTNLTTRPPQIRGMLLHRRITRLTATLEPQQSIAPVRREDPAHFATCTARWLLLSAALQELQQSGLRQQMDNSAGALNNEEKMS